MKKILACLALASSFAAFSQVPYKVTVPVPDQEEGTIAYMVNYDTGEKMDSVEIKAQKAFFTGDIDEPVLVRFLANGKRYGTSVLEQGGSAINQETGLGVGTMLNDQLIGMAKNLNEISAGLKQAETQEAADSIYSLYFDTEKKYVLENIDSPIGYYFFLDYAYNIPSQEMLDFLEANPSLNDYDRVKALKESATKVLGTSEGRPYKDFAVEYNGTTKKLSEYVGDGHYLLVDFWASWCGPCRREMATIKDLYNKYKDKGLQVLGVAVWDKPEDTEAAIKQLDIPWPCIINAQRIPTDLYGISGIPCVLLIGPDGKILSRGKQGAQLKAEVAKYLDK